ncbi:DUF2399 domain-containing protein [Asanoa siamensis]|uniref:TIGR02679 family protein n=1 Tax=Asanoa siamensis TaxID=926357 RepID=A0ABQ4D0Q9_9ACTN|nr:DUF2399 domain-containing protein [Asanoa siamensis]GIF76687.1 hypothetical protein Asi02nite_62050 [Asanoa siamensis]
MTPCPWCTNECDSIDFTPVRGAHIDWFWRQLADIGDRRGDHDLTTGFATATAPGNPSQRAAVLGLLGGRSPRADQRIRINLTDLTTRLHAHDVRLTPGMIAAHTAERRLGERIREMAQRRDTVARLRERMTDSFDRLEEAAVVQLDLDAIWPILQRNGWIGRLSAAPDGTALIDQAAAVIAALPADGERLDRRRLADTVTRFPHALDAGPLPGLVLSILAAAGAMTTGLPPRAAWAAVGVDCDDLTGGLLTLGIHPVGWFLPPEAVVTLPPRELAKCGWPTPTKHGQWIFVTENPSVVTAAADRLAAQNPPATGLRLLCTVGTPSTLEISAINRLAETGWRIAVRADFDQAGLRHVNALLRGVPASRPWRMAPADYLASLATAPADDRVRLGHDAVPDTPWDPALRAAMDERGQAAYEESLIEALLSDLMAGHPPQ